VKVDEDGERWEKMGKGVNRIEFSRNDERRMRKGMRKGGMGKGEKWEKTKYHFKW
jgi:hypothetical protein